MLLEGVGDVLQEDEVEDDVLVLGRVHVAAQLVRCQPELRFEGEVAVELLVFAEAERRGMWESLFYPAR